MSGCCASVSVITAAKWRWSHLRVATRRNYRFMSVVAKDLPSAYTGRDEWLLKYRHFTH